MFFSEQDNMMHSLLCKNAYCLRDLLCIDNSKRASEQTNIREYYVASVLDEIIKFLTSVIRWEDDFKDGFNKEIENTLIGNLIIQGLNDEINMYYRKLIESLVNVTLWSQIEDNNYLKYYYLIQERSHVKSEISNLREFYDIESMSNQTNLQNIEQEIIALFPSINESNCFFLDLSPRAICIPGTSVHCIESSLKYRLKRALRTTDDLGKILIGFTYDNYASASQKIHLSTNINSQHSEIIMVTIRFVFALISKLTVLCAQWLGVADIDQFKNVEEVLSAIPSSPAWYTPLLQDIYELDDYVFTPDGKLGRIIEKATSTYGYKTYKIHFLDDNGSGIIDDYYPAQYFKRIQPKQNLYEMCFKAQPEFKKLYDAAPDEERLKSCLDDAIKFVWNLEIKDRLNKK